MPWAAMARPQRYTTDRMRQIAEASEEKAKNALAEVLASNAQVSCRRALSKNHTLLAVFRAKT